jgi:hypothetical protein
LEQIQADLRPILIFGFTFDQETHSTKDAIKNVGRGPAQDVQVSIGTAKDGLPKGYISTRTIIGSGDEVVISINRELFVKAGMTIHYGSLDGRRFATSIYTLENAVKHDFAEIKS